MKIGPFAPDALKSALFSQSPGYCLGARGLCLHVPEEQPGRYFRLNLTGEKAFHESDVRGNSEHVLVLPTANLAVEFGLPVQAPANNVPWSPGMLVIAGDGQCCLTVRLKSQKDEYIDGLLDIKLGKLAFPDDVRVWFAQWRITLTDVTGRAFTLLESPHQG